MNQSQKIARLENRLCLVENICIHLLRATQYGEQQELQNLSNDLDKAGWLAPPYTVEVKSHPDGQLELQVCSRYEEVDDDGERGPTLFDQDPQPPASESKKRVKQNRRRPRAVQ